RRIATVTATVTTARAAYQDALSTRELVRTKIAAAVAAPPPVADLARRLDRLDAIRSAGRWARLAAAADAVTGYQQAVLTISRRAQRP
ncbi:MAG: hypothetical protein ACRDRJ_10160, partial [Streptosporangiaceae bacterium]